MQPSLPNSDNNGNRYTSLSSILDGYIDVQFQDAVITDTFGVRTTTDLKKLPIRDNTLRGRCITFLANSFKLHQVDHKKNIRETTDHQVNIIFKDNYKLHVYGKARRGAKSPYEYTEVDISLTHQWNSDRPFLTRPIDLYHDLAEQLRAYQWIVQTSVIPFKGYQHKTSCICSSCEYRGKIHQKLMRMIQITVSRAPQRYLDSDKVLIRCELGTCTCT